MNKTRMMVWAFLLGLALLVSACSPVIPNTGAGPGSLGEKELNSGDLEVTLQALGAQVERVGVQPQPYFEQDPLVLKVDGDTVEVFEFANPVDADHAAYLISPDGRWVGESKIESPNTPYFFKDQRLIVLYLGNDHATLVKLATILGMPITHPRLPQNFPGLDEQNA